MFVWTLGNPLGDAETRMNLFISSSSFHTQTFAYPESSAEREEILQGLQSRIEDIKSVGVDTRTVVLSSWADSGARCFHVHSPLPLPQVLSQTESYLQQLLVRAMAALPQWKVRVQKCKAVQMVLNLCSSSVTEKCLIAEAWCPTAKLPELQSALREGGVGQAKTAQTCRYRAGGITAPLLPLLFFFFFIWLTSGKVAAGWIPSTTGWRPRRLHPRSSLSTLSPRAFRTSSMLTAWRATAKSTQVGLCASKRIARVPHCPELDFNLSAHLGSGVHHHNLPLPVCGDVWGRGSRPSDDTGRPLDGPWGKGS